MARDYTDLSYNNKIIKMYENLNVELSQDILRRIKDTGDLSSFNKAQIRQIIKRGGKEAFLEALNKTSRFNVKRKKELKKMFFDIAQNEKENYKKIYKKKNKSLNLSESQLKLIDKMTKLTDKELKNFTKSIAFATKNKFIKTLDDMYVQVVTGGIDYNTAFRKTTNKLAESGIELEMKNGRKRSIEAAVKQNITTAIRNTSRLVNKDIGQELGCDGVQINISPNCRDNHKIINGRKFRLKSKLWQNNKHLLDDYNCQHYETFIFYNIEENIYSDEEIEEANNRTVIYKGKKIPYYEATQKLRTLERGVRNAKKQHMISNLKEDRQKVSKAQAKVRAYCRSTGLERDYQREYFASYNH